MIWPANIDGTKSRGQGRKIPQPRAVRQPSLKELIQAATSLGYSPEATEGSSKPSTPWEKTGYVSIKKPGPKIATMKLLAAEVAKVRQRQAQAAEAKLPRR